MICGYYYYKTLATTFITVSCQIRSSPNGFRTSRISESRRPQSSSFRFLAGKWLRPMVPTSTWPNHIEFMSITMEYVVFRIWHEMRRKKMRSLKCSLQWNVGLPSAMSRESVRSETTRPLSHAFPVPLACGESAWMPLTFSSRMRRNCRNRPSLRAPWTAKIRDCNLMRFTSGYDVGLTA